MFYRPGKRFFSLRGFELVIMYCIFSGVFGLPYRLTSLLIQGTFLHYTVYILHYAMYIVHYAMYIVHYAMYIVHYAMYIVHYAMYIVHCTARSTVCTVHITY